jgi:hypothetical protein
MRARRTTTTVAALAASVLTIGVGVSGIASAEPKAPSAGSSASQGRIATPANSGFQATGTIVGPLGYALNDVSVEAFVTGKREPVSSAISYGGDYQLVLKRGTYRIEVKDLAGRFASQVIAENVRITANKSLGKWQMRYAAPVPKSLPLILGGSTVGSKVLATPGVWARDDLTFDYTWLSGTRVVGKSAKYVVNARDVGNSLRVKVTASSKDSLDAVVASAAKKIALLPASVVATAPVVSGRNVTIPVLVRSVGTLRGTLIVTEVGKSAVLAKVTIKSGTKFLDRVVLKNVSSGKHTYEVKFSGNDQVAASKSTTSTVRVR